MSATSHLKRTEIRLFTLDLIQSGKSVWVEANGFSMYPALKPGDQIKISPRKIEEINLGDIVAFQRKNYFVVHRVHEKRNENETVFLTTKGDSGFQVDEPIHSEIFLGKITHVKRNNQEMCLTKMSRQTKLGTLYARFRVVMKVRFGWF